MKHALYVMREYLAGVLALAGTVLVASLLWMLLSLLILPLPAATAALFFTLGRAADDLAGNPFNDFLTGLRTYWRRATIIGLPALVLGVALGVDALYFLGQSSTALRGVGWLFSSFFLLWMTIMLMLWPVLVLRNITGRHLLGESFWLTMATLPWRLVTLIVAVLVTVVACAYPLFIPVAPGVIALASSWLALRTFRRYGLVCDKWV